MFTFDGSSSKVVDLRSVLQCVQGNNPRSISFTIKTTATGCHYILSTGSNAPSAIFSIGFSCGDKANVLQIMGYAVEYHPTTGKTINDGVSHSVLVTYDGTTVSIYVDGYPDNTATSWNTAYSTSTFLSSLNTIGNSGNYLGAYVDGSSGTWVGQLQNVQFYDYVISTSPTNAPSPAPTSSAPTMKPSIYPSTKPSVRPSSPSIRPSMISSITPSILNSAIPSLIPSLYPSLTPSLYPSGQPSVSTTLVPSSSPPSIQPSIAPSFIPSVSSSSAPTTPTPTTKPSIKPSTMPSIKPSTKPSIKPSTKPSNKLVQNLQSSLA